MKIRTKILILLAVFITTIIVLLGVIYFSSRQIAQATLTNSVVTDIRNEIAKLRTLTFDYTFYQSERSKQQWQSTNESLGKLLVPEKHKNHQHTKEELVFLGKMYQDNQGLGNLFSKLSQAGVSQELEAQIASQMMIKSQDMVSLASQLSESANKKIIDTQRSANYLRIIFLSSILLVALIIIYLIFVTILRPLSKLHEGMEKIEQGDFDYKVGIKAKDEIGQLSREFDDMTAKIKQSWAEVDKKVEFQTKEISQKNQDLENQKKAILNVSEDIESEKTKIAEVQAKDESYLSSIGEGIIVLDQEGKILLINPAACGMLGWEKEELLGKAFTDIIKLTDDSGKEIPSKDRPTNRVLKTGKKDTVLNVSYLRKDGSHFPIALTTAPIIFRDKTIGAIDVFRDITYEKEIDKAKTEFVSLAAHQLRTPLSAVNWYSEMLLGGDAGKITPKQKKYLQEIYHGNQRMVDLVNALLDVSRIELGTFEIEPEKMDIINEAKNLIKELVPRIEEKKQTLVENYDNNLPQIMADRKLFRIVVQNLLTNATKYSPEKAKITLSIKKKAYDIIISVKDTGFGIPKKQQHRVFKKLFRADNVIPKDIEGTGLGLYIIKSIVEQAKGKIWFSSEENKGSTFYVTIPLKGMSKKEGSKILEDIK
jgi:PAS domain S-box-containing protein